MDIISSNSLTDDAVQGEQARHPQDASNSAELIEVCDVIVETETVEDNIVEVAIVEIEIFGRENRRPPPARAYKVKIDHEHYKFEKRRVTGRELLVKAGKTPPENYEIEKRMHGGKYVPVGLDEAVDLGEPGIEVFETFPLDETEGC